VRFFGGWTFAPGATDAKDWVANGYAKGVPMGSDLPPAAGKAPTFLVWAVKDPTSGNLDRIQIVKGWTQSGQSFEKIYDVVWAGDRKADRWTGVVPPIGSTVDVEKATYTNTIGAVELATTWTDPDFDPSLHAFYYARVLEIPTPRWTTIQAAKLGIAPPDVVDATLQERAWSSPIWYGPTAEAAKAAKRGSTVVELTQKGAKRLGDAELRALVVEKSVWFENQVTGEKQMNIYGALGRGGDAAKLTPADPGWVAQQMPADQGHFQIRWVGRRAKLPSLSGDAAHDAHFGGTRPYRISNGAIVTDFAGTPIEVAVYTLGGQTFAARSNEFGYANYVLVPAEAEVSPLAAAAPAAPAK
jgi:hypothetical protein